MIPYAAIETVFLDVGNTLVSIDFDRVAAQIEERGYSCSPGELRRAEAAARPIFSRWLERGRAAETQDSFVFYLTAVFSQLGSVAAAGDSVSVQLASDLAPRLRLPGESDRLWRWVLPGVSDALESLRSLGLELIVVSNSDGTVERGLVALGLRPYFSSVVDSAVVGFEKPDPRIFRHALDQAGAPPHRVLHVGDLYHTDITGARSVGVHAVLLDPFDDWGEVDCERVADLPTLAGRLRCSRSGTARP